MTTLLILGVLALMAAATLIAFVWARESKLGAGDQGGEVSHDYLMGDRDDYLC